VVIVPLARSAVRLAASAVFFRRPSIWMTAADVFSRFAALVSVRRARSSDAWAI